MLADRSAALEGIGLHASRRACGWRRAPRSPRARRPGPAPRASRPARGAAAPARACLMAAAIEVSDLRKSYGSGRSGARRLVRGRSAGEMFGLLGPNGAGKTTTVEILEGYRDRSGGEVRVLGHDPEQRDRRPPGAGRDRAAELRLLPARDGARGRHPLRQGLPGPARPRGDDRARRARGEGRRAHEGPLGRPAPPARPGARRWSATPS